MKRLFTVCLIAAVAIVQLVSFANELTLTRVTSYDDYDAIRCGIDYKGDAILIGLKQDGDAIIYSFLDSEDLTPYKTCRISGVYGEFREDGHYSYRPWTSMGVYAAVMLYDIYTSPVAVQGLLDNEHDWCFFVNVGKDDDTYEEVIVNEEGKRLLTINDGMSLYGTCNSSWHRLYIYCESDSGYPKGVYTLRTTFPTTEVNRRPDTESVNPKGIYTLEGVKVDRTEKGVYIVDGKKILK